jgi:hypothetical protein
MDIHHDLMTPREEEMGDNEGMPELVKCATFKADAPTGCVLRISADLWRDTCAERDSLAALVTELRGALERLLPAIAERNHWFDTCTRVLARDWERKASNAIDGLEAALTKADAALSLPLPASAERVRVEREYCDAALEWTNRGPFKWEDYERFCAADTALRAARGGK